MGSASSHPGTLPFRRRLMAVLGMASLLMAMLTPIVDLHAGALAAQKEGECKPGFVFDERSGQCVPEKPVDEPSCEPGTVLDERSGRCVPEKPAKDPPKCEPGTVLNARTGECVPEKPVDEPHPECPKDQTWNPDRGCASVATEPPAREPETPTSDVYIEKYDCADRPGANPNPGDLLELVEQCVANQVPIEMSHDVEGDGEDPSTQAGTSEFSWPDQPSGTHVIEEQVPEGYGYPWIYCTVVAPGEDRRVPSRIPVNKGSMVVLEVMPGADVYCLWFNVPEPKDEPPTNTGGVIDIHKSVCPAGVPPDMEVEAYQDECELTGGWDFKVEWTEGTFTTDANGFVGWTDVPLGQWRITEALPEGYVTPVVWCRWLSWPPDVVGIDSSWFPLDAADGIILIPLKYGDMHLECRWFNMRDKGAAEPTPLSTRQGDTPTQAPQPTDVPEPTAELTGAEIIVHKFACPVDYNLRNSGVDPVADCTTPVNGVSFSLESSDPGGYMAQAVTGDAIEGAVTFRWLPAGDYILSEEPYAGIQHAFVWSCTINGEPMAGDVPLNNGYAFPLSVEEGDSITCHWFNVPAGDVFVLDPDPRVPTEMPPGEETGGVIEVYKYICPPRVTQGLPIQDYQVPCEQPGDGIVFETGWGEFAATDGVGRVEWTGVAPGTWQVAEVLPEGYDTPVVFCRWLADSGEQDWVRLEVSPSGMVAIDIAEGDMAVQCFWFNIPFAPEPSPFPEEPQPTEETPEAGVEIQVYKLWCSEGATSRASHQQLVSNLCTFSDKRSANVTVASEGESSTRTVVGRTPVTWVVPSDTWTMSETPVDGYIDPVVWCQDVETTGKDGRSPGGNEPYQLKGRNWSWAPRPGSTGGVIACAIFNIPEPVGQAPSGGALDLYHYSCPHSTVALSHAAPVPDAFLDACAPVAGWSFQLEADDSVVESVTDQEGTLSWSGLPGGQWTVSQTVPPDHERPPAIWCQYLTAPSDAGLPMGWFPIRKQLLISREIMRLTVEHEGIHLECHWFNRLVEPHHLWLKVYECPRSAAGSSDSHLLFYAGCREAEAGVHITLEFGDGSASVTKFTSTRGSMRWWGVPDGTHSIVVPQHLAGFPTAQAYCGHFPLTYPDPVEFQPSQVPFSNGTLRVTFDGQMEREGINCKLFAFTLGLAVSGPASGGETNLPITPWFMNQGSRQTRGSVRSRWRHSPLSRGTTESSGGRTFRS